MQSDEKAIRDLVDRWLAATQAGDLATVLNLMAEDVIFMVPGKKPFGKKTFAANSRKMKNVQIKASSKVAEINVAGDGAWMRNWLKVTITPPGQKPIVRSGYTLTILRKERNGGWVIARDANLLGP